MEKNKKRFNPNEAIVPGISLLFGIAYFVQTADASWIAIKWAYGLGTLTGLFLLGIIFTYVFSIPVKKEKTDTPANKYKPLIILIAPLLYIATMPYLGFALSSFVFLTLLFRWLGGKSWSRNTIIAFTITAVLYVAMVLLMQMSLPRLEIGSFIL
ncbi:Tripartite tricarboxylate transporter TctB family protein [Desulfuromusa kysingii]|uniref:Tripartite tricarboxylate transporter TctB family protein n=1 Tax=Desulfuromusa kysingii TaxID=37625 RepID=A0A1H3WA46_9BACT|nr:tripartite tricarboxylate transporter TctB family protein [Desulfuromusa kysingii]SDZ83148.1 Tripartite tricarboxylate transporter TctB family protein [Desulfuromusa kysingii]